ncbi:uroporphyrinogen decarboxylase [Pantoea sp. Mhis]|uniref:uroporphyrinogen decarboxylase n=1 Tax=Pantoea sp. Mhis TaxID=2576759 RepID=UPI001357B87C|nr:uroporphyrinogen decarboxylase [Pantoea sp. Mhis]MXP56520.1 uroporphyrinogen decarboxylase [Pantoea sp. Mhis]
MNRLKNDRYLRALLRQPIDITPIWMMRQAGRYLPEYKVKLIEAGNFIALCKNIELASEVTLQPLQRYELDAAILFSDILIISEAMGMELSFEANIGPRFSIPITSLNDINKLSIPDPELELGYITDIIRKVRYELNNTIPLIGFSGSPWTLATYMIEGTSSKFFSKIKRMMYCESKILHLLLNKLADSIILYLNAQIKAGIQSVIIFDTCGGVLSKRDYIEFSLYYMHKIIDNIIKKNEGCYVPITLFTKGGGQWLELMAATGCNALGIDWMTDIADARRRVGNKVALQGNMDPSILYASPERIELEVAYILKNFGIGEGHIFSLGHGVYQDISYNHVKVCVNAVHRLSTNYHLK